ncbi:rhomboid family intramembrane serine protease [Streptomyces bambusae]|uniref:Rhomboid family intramembrane serine protease n=1 Tax=Streptomyces bambusae TaxID=1550616 RepID=A0ABS6Z9Y9_9ACTN|nr:rhomboid family intramembrane serine protease [Streptomyces bambusae]MBW5484557.1 rhomboid family intramembrane serine protease [Streptomyces bambusae]
MDAGRRAPRDPHLVTKVLVAVDAVVFLVFLVVPADPGTRRPLELLGLYADRPGGPDHGVAAGEYHRLLTSVFLHQTWWHLAGNMIGLWVLGGPLEAELGRARYLCLYLLSGLGGSALVYLLAEPNTPTLGASGAVFGLLGATVVHMRRTGEDMRPIAVVVVLMLLIGFVPLSADATWTVSWQDHVGGLVAGFLLGLGMVRPPAGRGGAALRWGSCAAVPLLVAAAVLVRTAELT